MLGDAKSGITTAQYGTIISKDLRLGFLSRVREMAQDGVRGGELAPLFMLGNPNRLSIPLRDGKGGFDNSPM